ncbi:MAG: catechol 1,2-dioxygenase, partial [Gluconacetobacter diazotrophicus]|nr:catechol 1,2-dioxygenase [Gluconacetobacter diazotrophicus]
ALTRHLHGFVRDVKLTEVELWAGIRVLAELGQYTTDVRNEMMQASDIFGVSSLVALLAKPLTEVESPATIMGPFYRSNAPDCDRDDNISRTGSRAEQLVVDGRVLSSDGTPLPGATIDVWQADPNGFYENQDPAQPDHNLRGKFGTGADGTYRFVTLRPGGYPVPTDGPIGRILEAQNRSPMRPAHIHFIVSAPGHETIITQLYIDEEQALVDDVVLAVTAPLVGHPDRVDALTDMTPPGVRTPYGAVTFDFHLRPGIPTFPVPPIP